MNYWLNLYTWKTWQEFLQAGGNISGFRENRWRTVQKIKPGDILISYMTGISRYFAIQEVTGEPFQDSDPIWGEAIFPSRIPVKTLLSLDPEYAVPVTELTDLSYFQDMKSPHSWTGHFRGSPNKITKSDAQIIIRALEQAKENPVRQEFDKKKLMKKVSTYESKGGTVSIPEEDEDVPVDPINTPIEQEVTHDEIQWLLLFLGEQFGLDLWVANNDKGKSYHDKPFSEFKGLRKTLPIQFDEATNRTIALIDVLWLQGNSIVAAFEIEHTSAIYSGLLRMADLITMQPNIDIPLYIVAPDERRDKVVREINRPVFSQALKKSLPDICKYISYSELKEKIEKAEQGGFLKHLKVNYIDEIAEDVTLGDL